MEESVVSVIIPPSLHEMLEKVMDSLRKDDYYDEDQLDYIGGWINGRAEVQYEGLVRRDGIPDDPKVIKLLCEIAVLRALLEWHEVRNRPPPMPSIKSL